MVISCRNRPARASLSFRPPRPPGPPTNPGMCTFSRRGAERAENNLASYALCVVLKSLPRKVLNGFRQKITLFKKFFQKSIDDMIY
jgi:hypothetical protein